MQGAPRRYSVLYDEIVENPELAKFRRHLDLWTWILYNETGEIDKLRRECDELIETIGAENDDWTVRTLLDYHQAYHLLEHPVLRSKIDVLKISVRQYSRFWPMLCAKDRADGGDVGEDLCLATHVANLPHQSDVYARHFAARKTLFEKDLFGPTKEKAAMYTQVPSHADTCSFKDGDLDEQDMLTAFVIRHLESVNTYVTRFITRVLRQRSLEDGVAPQQYLELDKIQMVANILTAIYVPVYLAICLGILSCIESEKTRIVVLGVLGILLALLMVVCVPVPKRNDMFAFMAAFFAVGGIFIGAKRESD